MRSSAARHARQRRHRRQRRRASSGWPRSAPSSTPCGRSAPTARTTTTRRATRPTIPTWPPSTPPGPKVAAVLAGIHARSPHARVLIVGYPDGLPVNGSSCWPTVPLSSGDVTYFNYSRAATQLGDRIDRGRQLDPVRGHVRFEHRPRRLPGTRYGLGQRNRSHLGTRIRCTPIRPASRTWPTRCSRRSGRPPRGRAPAVARRPIWVVFDTLLVFASAETDHAMTRHGAIWAPVLGFTTWRSISAPPTRSCTWVAGASWCPSPRSSPRTSNRRGSRRRGRGRADHRPDPGDHLRHPSVAPRRHRRLRGDRGHARVFIRRVMTGGPPIRADRLRALGVTEVESAR